MADDVGGGQGGGTADEAASVLASRWPRTLAERVDPETLAESWIRSRRGAGAAGLPAYPRAPLSPALASALFEARRARRVVRGLEPASAALAQGAAGRRAAAHRQRAGEVEGDGAAGRAVRIARLVVISADASARLFRKIERLYADHRDVVEVLVVLTDELGLGAASFGPGERARVVLIDHKDAVARILAAVELALDPSASAG
ncbi:MAG: hypothetical protein R3F35_01420 [Myxococcota bacterium]